MPTHLKLSATLATLLLAALMGQADAQTSGLPGFQPTGSLTATRSSHAATLLANGKVLVTGGGSGVSNGERASAELYDPATGTWATTGSMTDTRFVHTTTRLTNGLVLVVGGYGGGAIVRVRSCIIPSPGRGRRPVP